MTDVDLIINVNTYEDNSEGNCGPDQSSRCTLRAAFAEAAQSNGKAVIMVPTDDTYYIRKGEIKVKKGNINVIGDNGLAIIDGVDNNGRFLRILANANLEIAHITMQNFL